MIRKFSTLKLGGIFILLLIVVLAVEYYEEDAQSGTFRQSLSNINIDKVSSIVIYPKSKNPKEISLIKKNEKWFVKLIDDKLFNADEENVKQAIIQLAGLKPSNLSANDPAKWNEFQVDTTGTRVKVYEEGNNTLDIILGRFSYKGQQQQQMYGMYGKQPEMYSYVRLTNENEVYSVEGFLDMSFNRVSDYWRDQKIVNGKSDNWKKLTFSYPADSSFVLEKKENNWFYDVFVKTDSALVTKFLKQMEYISHSFFVNDVELASLGKETFKLTIESDNDPAIQVNAYTHNVHEWIITTNLNEGTIFSAKTSDDAFKKLFPSKMEIIAVDTTNKVL